MVLTVMAPLIKNKLQVIEIVYSLLAVNCKHFTMMNSELLTCRVIRLIGYYPFATYFYFMQEKMRMSKACLIEGILAFERIIKNTEYLKTFPLMYTVFIEMLDLISVSESIFEQLILNRYNEILSKSDQLYSKVVQKIWETFREALTENPHQSKHEAIQCLNYIEKLLKKERREKHNNLLLDAFREMEKIGRNF